MKKVLLVAAVLIILACIIALIVAVINWQAYRSLRDGTPQHYALLRSRAITLFIAGGVLALLAAGCLVFYFKI